MSIGEIERLLSDAARETACYSITDRGDVYIAATDALKEINQAASAVFILRKALERSLTS